MQNFNVNAVLFVILDLLRKYRPKGYWPFLYTCKQWEYNVFTKKFKVCIFYSIYINKFHFMFIVRVYYLNAFNFDSQLIERKSFYTKCRFFYLNISFFFFIEWKECCPILEVFQKILTALLGPLWTQLTNVLCFKCAKLFITATALWE